MPVFINKPEFALKRAEEFLDVGKRVRALEALTEAIKNRKHRIWQKSHEDIMKKFIQLCVELKQSQTAKEGLHQYKNLTANVNPKSLEDIIRYYLKLSESKCDEAREKATAAAATPIVDVDDLDLAESPEGMLLKVVSTDTSQDRADRVVLLPWVRFNWEAYRHCLDLLRNLSKLEPLYHDIASQAFKFCLKYVRKTELRKLCDMLRNHIGQISKREVVTANAVNLNNPETQELNLRTRLIQLDHAIAMEMWQEAFRAIDDVHALMSMLKKVPKAALKANYFDKLALVFLRAGNAVFHAAAQHQLFNLYRNFRRDLQSEELRRLAVTVLFATLAVPLQPPRTQLESLIEYDDAAAQKLKTLTNLVGFGQPPSRTRLVEDLQKQGILQHVKPELQQLYHALEMSFDPLNSGRAIARVLSEVNSLEEMAGVRHYAKAIEEVAVGKQLRQLSQAYDSMEIERVVELMPYTTWQTIERVAIETARNTDLSVRIDHRAPGLFVFGGDGGLTPYAVGAGDHGREGEVPTDRVRSQLVVLLASITRTHRTIKSDQDREDEGTIRANLFNLYRKNAQRDHVANLGRQAKSEARQKDIERRELERTRKAEMAKKTQEKEIFHAEKLRQERHMTESELQKKAQKEKEIERNIVREKVDNMKLTEYGQRVLKELGERNVDELSVRELDELEKRHRQEIKREEEENAQRLKIQEKKIDHTVRAKHFEEIALRRDDNQGMIEAFKHLWLKDENRRIDEARAKREADLRKRERMRLIVAERQEFWSQVHQRKSDLNTQKMTEWDTLYKTERATRLVKRREERERNRRDEYNAREKKEREEAEKMENAKKLEEEKMRQEEAERVRRSKLEHQTRLQREREAEIERKLAESNASQARVTRPEPPAFTRAGAAGPTPDWHGDKQRSMAAGGPGADGDRFGNLRSGDAVRAGADRDGDRDNRPRDTRVIGGLELVRNVDNRTQPAPAAAAAAAAATAEPTWARRTSGAEEAEQPPAPPSNVYRPPRRDQPPPAAEDDRRAPRNDDRGAARSDNRGPPPPWGGDRDRRDNNTGDRDRDGQMRRTFTTPAARPAASIPEGSWRR